jgi:hypothetical protein
MIQTELAFEQKRQMMLEQVLPYYAHTLKTEIKDTTGL